MKKEERKIQSLERKLQKQREASLRKEKRLQKRAELAQAKQKETSLRKDTLIKKRAEIAKVKAKQLPFSKLRKKLDKVFSLWIRTRDGGICITCGVKKPIAEMQCGHFCSRRFSNTRWDEKNTACQCYPCNVLMKGQLDMYALILTQRYGDKIISELVTRSRVLRKFTRQEMEDMITHYSDLTTLIF